MKNTTVEDFKWIKGQNDIEYIYLLQEHLKNKDQIINKAISKIKKLSKTNTGH